MRKSLKILCAVTILCMLSTIVASASSGTLTEKITFRSISIVVDGKEIAPCDINGNSTEPFIRNADGSTYLPVRAVAGALGLDVGWDANSNTVILKSNGTVNTGKGTPNKTYKELTSKLTYRDISITLDGKKVSLLNAAGNPVEPFIKDGSTYIPVRAVATALGCEVGWNGSTSTVTLTKGSGTQVNPVNPVTDDKLTAFQISQKCTPAVFSVESYGINGGLIGTGTGFFISNDGYAVTNMHVVENAYDVIVQTNDGKKYDNITVVDGNWDCDLALLKVNGGKSFNYLEVADSKGIFTGQQVYAIGNPFGLNNTLSQGIISNNYRKIDDIEYVQISVPIAHGSSGGPLINEQGKVVGVTTAGFVEAAANLNLAVPSNGISKLEKNRTGNRVWFSFDIYDYYDVPDFGVMSNSKMVYDEDDYISSYYEYDLDDFRDAFGLTSGDRRVKALSYYKAMLEVFDFELLDEERDDSGYIAYYEGDEYYVNFGYDLDEWVFFVYIEEKVHEYKNNPGVPDLGWFMGIQPSNTERGSDWWGYTYNWRNEFTYNQFYNVMDNYYDLLEKSGYKFVYVNDTKDGFLFEGKGLSIGILYNGPTVYVDVKKYF